MAITDFQLQWHTEKYGDVVTAIEVLDPAIFEKDPLAALLRTQIDASKNALYQHVLKNHCTVDDTEY